MTGYRIRKAKRSADSDDAPAGRRRPPGMPRQYLDIGAPCAERDYKPRTVKDPEAILAAAFLKMGRD